MVTLVRGDVLAVLADTFQPQPAFAAKSPFCQDEGIDGTVAFVAVRTGDTSVYFVGQHSVTTDQIDVETPPSDIRLLAFPLGVALLLAGLFGLAMRFRQQYSIGPQDLSEQMGPKEATHTTRSKRIGPHSTSSINTHVPRRETAPSEVGAWLPERRIRRPTTTAAKDRGR